MEKEKPRCQLCNAKPEYQEIKSNNVYGGTSDQKFWYCAECDAIYLYPIPSEDDDVEFYRDQFDKWMVKRSGDETWTDPAIQFNKMQKRELPLRLPWIQKYAKPGQRVLEIGSSSGFTLSALKEMGCECVGVEVSNEYADYARKIGLSTYPNLKELAPYFGTFDLVLHYYVLEHVGKPLDFLKECMKYLKPDGKMIFEVPNGNDPLISLYKIPAFHKFYWWRAHHWYFTPRSLHYLLKELHRPYEIYLGQRYDLSNHIRWMLTGQPGGMGKYSHIFSANTEKAYAEDLKRNGYCDYLIAITS